MTRIKGKPRADESAWGADTLRLTLFHPVAEVVRADGWWEQVTGEPPESTTGKPKTGERVELGPIGEAQLLLNAQPHRGRIDWVCKSGDDPETSPHSFPTGAGLFVNLMNKFLQRDDLPTVNRLAFGAVVWLPVADVKQGYETISDYLNFTLDRETSQDFMYQINRRRSSKAAPGKNVNRLMKWSVSKISKQSLAVSDEGLVAVAASEDIAAGCRLELDINTVPDERAEIGRECYVPLLSEFLTWAREIIREGDIP